MFTIREAVPRFQFLCFFRHNGLRYQEFALEFVPDKLVVASKWRGDCVGASLGPLLLRTLVFLSCYVKGYQSYGFSVNSNISLLYELFETIL